MPPTPNFNTSPKKNQSTNVIPQTFNRAGEESGLCCPCVTTFVRADKCLRERSGLLCSSLFFYPYFFFFYIFFLIFVLCLLPLWQAQAAPAGAFSSALSTQAGQQGQAEPSSGMEIQPRALPAPPAPPAPVISPAQREPQSSDWCQSCPKAAPAANPTGNDVAEVNSLQPARISPVFYYFCIF